MKRESEPERFNVRVYGLLIHEDHVLVTDEIRLGVEMTKFPGGGLHFGEGLEQGLKREWMEELSIEVKAHKLFYINDFFIRSAFNPAEQVLSVYYLIQAPSPEKIAIVETPFDIHPEADEPQVFRWIHLDQLTHDHLKWPADQAVARMLREQYHSSELQRQLDTL